MTDTVVDNSVQRRVIDGRWYLGTVATYFTGVAILQFIIPVTVQLKLGLGGKELGIAQGALLLTIALFLLIGGPVVDVSDKRKLLARSFFAAALLPLGLAVYLGFNSLSYMSIVAFVIMFGAVAGVLNTCRDAILNQVAERSDYQVLVAKAGAVQYGSAIVGYTLAAATDWIDMAHILIAHGVLMVLGGLSALRMQVAAVGSGATATALSRVSYGEALKIPGIKVLLFQVAALGAFGVGAFLVLVPEKVFAGYGMAAYGLLMANSIFTIGTIMFSARIIKSAQKLSGRPKLLSIVGAMMALLVALIGFDFPLYGFLLVMFLWGGVTAVTAIFLRMQIQGLPHETIRGRIMSLYNLAFIGGTPAGAVILGAMSSQHSLAAAALLAAIVMLVVFFLSWVIGARAARTV